MNEFLQMYIDTLEDIYDQKFNDYSLVQVLIKKHFDDEVSQDNIRRYYENNTEEEDLRIQINNLQIQY